MRIPPSLELRARNLVMDAIAVGGEIWQHVTPGTVELLVEAVALDLCDEGADMSRPIPDVQRPTSDA